MDANSSQPSEPLKYQTWFLKVSIHCEGCRRKVKKVLQSIDGVFTTTVDPQQQKVTVTGSVGVETLIKKLDKAGKHAEIWPENLAAGKGKQQKKNKQTEGAENHSTTTNAEPNTKKNRGIEKSNGESKRAGISKPSGGESAAAEPEKNKGGESEGGCGKKKKNRGESNESRSGSAASRDGAAHSGTQVVGQMNLSPTRQQSYPYPEAYCYPPLVYLATHNRLCPMGTMGGPCYYVSPLPYMSSDPYHRFQSAPFEIFSDENANACSIM